MGGHGLYSTVGDYCRFIRMWLNDGAEGGRVLKRDAVLMAEKNGLGEMRIEGFWATQLFPCADPPRSPALLNSKPRYVGAWPFETSRVAFGQGPPARRGLGRTPSGSMTCASA